jgi:hypothetical protein
MGVHIKKEKETPNAFGIGFGTGQWTDMTGKKTSSRG